MISVVEILEHHLPIPRHRFERERSRADCVREVIIFEIGRVAAQGRGQRFRIDVEVHEDEPEPLLHCERWQAPIGFGELLSSFHCRRAEQTAVLGVDPNGGTGT